MTNEPDDEPDDEPDSIATWMTANDALLWEIERDPVLRSPITAVLWLDRAPDSGRVDVMIDRLLAACPRFRQRVASSPAGLSTPRWELDPDFDIEFHVRRIRLADHHTSRRDVLDHAQQIAAHAFDKNRPPWEVEFVDEVADGAAACVMKVHHSIADGLGLVSILQHMVDLERDPATGDTLHEHATTAPSLPGVIERLGAAALQRARTDARDAQRIVASGARTARDLVRHPLDTARSLIDTGTSIAKMVAPAGTPLSPLMTGRSTRLHMDVVETELAPLHDAAKAHGASVNDAFVTVVVDALDRYHRRHGQPAEAIRMHMPVSVRTAARANTLDNQFTPTRFVLPLGEAAPEDRLATIRQLLRDVRDQPALPHTDDISATVRRLGGPVSTSVIGSMMRGVDVTTTNVPGPPFPVFLAGTRVTDFFGFGPLAGSAINLTFFSYDGVAEFGITTDAAAVPDPASFVEELESAIGSFVELSTS